jgi:hypothetical protein
METFKAARIRLLAGLNLIGWKTSSFSLKVPWAEIPNTDYRLWFRPQAIYLDLHSLHIDMRDMPVSTLIADAERRIESLRRQNY